MGFTTINWARSIKLDKSAKAVLVDLALRANAANECWPFVATIAETLNVSKDTVERAIKRLRMSGLITMRQQYDRRGKRTSNRYRLNVGATPICLKDDRVNIAQHNTLLSRNLRLANPHHAGDHKTYQSLRTSKEKKEEASKKDAKRFAETDGSTSSTWQMRPGSGGSDRLPFTEAVLKAIAGLGVDLEALIERYRNKTKNRDIGHPSAYLLRMGQEEAAKALGISIEAVKRLNSSSAVVRAAAIGSAMEGPFFDPSQEFIEKLTKRLLARGLNAEDVIARWRAKKPRGCTTAAGAERSLEAFVTNEIFYRRDEALRTSNQSTKSTSRTF